MLAESKPLTQVGKQKKRVAINTSKYERGKLRVFLTKSEIKPICEIVKVNFKRMNKPKKFFLMDLPMRNHSG